MDNHFHLIVNCPDGNSSSFMQRFEQQYVLKHNRAIGRSGPLFTARFGSVPIGADDHDADDGGLIVSRYVHRNPLDIVPVNDLARYPHSSYGAYLGVLPTPDWLRTDILSQVYDSRTCCLRTFTERPHESDRTPAAGRRHQPFLLTEVLVAVAAEMNVSVEKLPTPTPGLRRLDRTLAVELVARLRPTGEQDRSRVFGVERRTVQRMVSNEKALLATDVEFAVSDARAVARLFGGTVTLDKAA